FFRYEPDNFAADRFNTVTCRFPFDELENARDGRLLEVGEIHGNLRQPTHQKSSAFHEAKAAGGLAHRLSDFPCYSDVGGIQKNVVGDEKFTRAHHGGPRGRMHGGFAKIGLAVRVGSDFGADAFELSATDVFEILAFRADGGGFVEIDRNRVALPNLLADLTGNGDAIF